MGDEQQGPVRWWKQKGYPVTGLDGFSSCYGRWCHPAYAHPFRLKMGLEGWPLKNFLFSQRMQYSHGSPQLSIALVPRDPKPPSNFQGRQTRAWAKCSHTFKKKNPPPPTSWLPLPSPARQYTKGGVYWPFWKHPEILNPIIGHITSSNLMTSLRSTNPHSNRLRCLSTPIFPGAWTQSPHHLLSIALLLFKINIPKAFLIVIPQPVHSLQQTHSFRLLPASWHTWLKILIK